MTLPPDGRVRLTARAMPPTADQRPSGSAPVLALDLVGTHPLMAIADAEALEQHRPLHRAVGAHASRVQASRVRIVPTALRDDVAMVGAPPLVAGPVCVTIPEDRQPHIRCRTVGRPVTRTGGSQ